MKLLLSAIFSGACVALAPAAEQKEPAEYQQAVVEASSEYQAAALAKLIDQGQPPAPVQAPLFGPQIKPEIPQSRREKAEAAFRAILIRFQLSPTDQPPEFEDRGTELAVTQRDKENKTFLSIGFDAENQPVSIYFSDARLPLSGNRITTPEKFAEYAADCYLRAFGFKPVGDLEIDHINAGPEGLTGASDLTWTPLPEGIPMKTYANLGASLDGFGRWTLSCHRGPTATEVADIATLIQTYPTTITEARAVAIAWKNWKAVRDVRYENGSFRLWSKLRELAPDEIKPWSGIEHGGFSEQQAWLPAEPPLQPLDPVAYEITMSEGLFTAHAIIDRRSGKILRLSHARMQW
ncbi:hypothetical protein [Haloferula sp. BvORR071]|uniref:hypothetical protein n=1 Tax=Haloferula sp. BvORR071 TaxID=1396141 RepID=UPI00054E86F4|nr:hypothetical protein [Haloferula sp. BvORR071]